MKCRSFVLLLTTTPTSAALLVSFANCRGHCSPPQRYNKRDQWIPYWWIAAWASLENNARKPLLLSSRRPAPSLAVERTWRQCRRRSKAWFICGRSGDNGEKKKKRENQTRARIMRKWCGLRVFGVAHRWPELRGFSTTYIIGRKKYSSQPSFSQKQDSVPSFLLKTGEEKRANKMRLSHELRKGSHDVRSENIIGNIIWSETKLIVFFFNCSSKRCCCWFPFSFFFCVYSAEPALAYQYKSE